MRENASDLEVLQEEQTGRGGALVLSGCGEEERKQLGKVWEGFVGTY